MENKKTVAERRKYRVIDVQAAKQVARVWLEQAALENAVDFGLPEVDDRYHIWRVPLVAKMGGNRIGEVVIDAHTSLIVESKSTDATTLEARLLGREETTPPTKRQSKSANQKYTLSDLRNTIAAGDCETILQDLPAGSVDLIFTSPPTTMHGQNMLITSRMKNTC